MVIQKLPADITITSVPKAKRSIKPTPKVQLKSNNNAALKPKTTDDVKPLKLPLNSRVYNVNAYMKNQRYSLTGNIAFGSGLKVFLPLQMKHAANLDQKEVWTQIEKHIINEGKKMIILNFPLNEESNPLYSGFINSQRFGLMQCLMKNIDRFYMVAIDSKTVIPESVANKLKFSDANAPDRLFLGIILFTPRLPKKRQRLVPESSRDQFSSLQRLPFLRRNLRIFGVYINYKKDEIKAPIATLQHSARPYNTRERPMKKSYLKSPKSNGVVKRKYTKKKKPTEAAIVTGTNMFRKKQKIAPVPFVSANSSGELSDHEMDFLLENLTSDEDTKVLMDTIEKPSLLLSPKDSSMPIDMELDMELSGPSSLVKHAGQGKVVKNKTYEGIGKIIIKFCN